ncbi:MAG: hypothetical protein R3B57_04650 [Phycisphaerales bacterium]
MTTACDRMTLAGLGVVIALGLSGVARAQTGPERVDAGTSDVGPLSESLRMLPVDLRVSDDFENVYRVTDANGDERFIRRQGALVAVFPRSEYIPTGFGPMAAIPAGTWFRIGEPLDVTGGGGSHSAIASRQRIDRRVGQRPASVVDARSPRSTSTSSRKDAARSGEAPTPWRSERARGVAISRLLASAASSD